MSYKTILVYLDTAKRSRRTLEVAIPLAKNHHAHLIGFHVRPYMPHYVTATTAVPKELMARERERVDAYAGEVELLFWQKTAGLHAEWRAPSCLGTHISATVVDHAMCADLIVASRIPKGDLWTWPSLPADVAVESGRPAIILPESGAAGHIAKNVLVAWSASRESARAAFDAVPILAHADKVSLATVTPSAFDEEKMIIATHDLVSALKRHGVNASTTKIDKPDISVGETLIAHAAEQGCDLIVMGCYGHSRLRETVFGGTSQHILERSPVPVLMTH